MSSVPTVPTAVSDWLPSVFSRLHMSPLMLVLLVMFMPPDEPICLFFILDAKSLSATTINRGGRQGQREKRGERTGKRRGEERKEEKRRGEERPAERGGCERRDDGGGKEERIKEERRGDRRGTGDEEVWGEKEKRTEFRYRSS